MRRYCKNCGTEYRNIPSGVRSCPICLAIHPTILQEIPEWETPEQYQARTGKAWHDEWCVWIRDNKHRYAALFWHTKYETFKRWQRSRVSKGLTDGSEFNTVLCADHPYPPPNDWKPESDGGAE